MKVVGKGNYEGSAAATTSRQPSLVRTCAAFVAIGLLLYAGFFALSEALVYRYAQRNPFYQISAAPEQHFDHVILGASHAMPFGFEGMNQHLEQLSGKKMINLSMEGSGVLPNNMLLDYFLRHHTADSVVYFLDSFALYSSQWNEERLTDSDLLRAPFDPKLVATLWSYPWARHLLPNYITGFAKINNPDRFAPDLSDAELNKFERVYRPIPQIDRQRIQFLYPADQGPETPEFEHYLTEFDELIAFADGRGLEVTVIKPPTPDRIKEMLPEEAEFDVRVREVVEKHGVDFRDFSGVTNDPEYFYDSDHLNREGVLAFSEQYLAPLLTAAE